MGLGERILYSNPADARGEHRARSSAWVPSETPGQELHIREFKLSPEVQTGLTKEEARTVELLARATRRVASLYAFHERDESAFYPEGVRKSEILRQAEEKPNLLSPYTRVEFDETGQLIASPAVRSFQDQIKKLAIVDLLEEAANEAGKGERKDRQLKDYLKAKAEALKTGKFKKSEKMWLERPDEPVVDIVIGLYDTYTDRLLKVKYAWQAWVGVLDAQSTADSQWFLNAFLNEVAPDQSPRVKMRIDHTRIMAGQAGKYGWIGNSLPCQSSWREEMGSKFTIFRPRFEARFSEKQLPAFRRYINPSKTEGLRNDFIRLAALRSYIAHESSHHLIREDGLTRRLQQHKAWVKELYCDLTALIGYRNVGNISRRESEIALGLTLAKSVLEFEEKENRNEYHESTTALVNYLIAHGAINITDGTYDWFDTQLVFETAGNLHQTMQRFIDEGRFREVAEFYAKYCKPEIFKHVLLETSYSQEDFLLNN